MATSGGRRWRGIDSPALPHSSASLTGGLKLSRLLSAFSAHFSSQLSFHQPCNNKSRPSSLSFSIPFVPAPRRRPPITSATHLLLFSSLPRSLASLMWSLAVLFCSSWCLSALTTSPENRTFDATGHSDTIGVLAREA